MRKPKAQVDIAYDLYFFLSKKVEGESKNLMCDGGRIDMKLADCFFARSVFAAQLVVCILLSWNGGWAFWVQWSVLACGAFGLRWHCSFKLFVMSTTIEWFILVSFLVIQHIKR